MPIDQPDIFDWTPPIRLGQDIGGVTFIHGRDGQRLGEQILRVFNLIRDGQWWTPAALEAATGDNWASISARLRDLRKPSVLGAVIEREYLAHGLWRYRLDLKSLG
jgi:hypothetical protein